MVFSQLSSDEKDAFFVLLDELSLHHHLFVCNICSGGANQASDRYFASRPEIFQNFNVPGSVVENAATTAAHKAFTSPAARSAAQEAMPSAMKSIGASWNAKREEQNPGPSSVSRVNA
jgi:hypothetical protein